MQKQSLGLGFFGVTLNQPPIYMYHFKEELDLLLYGPVSHIFRKQIAIPKNNKRFV